jgi:hypothetical protein
MKVFDFPQYSPEWWKVRQGVPTSSNAHKIIMPAKGELSKQADDYACDLVAEKYDAYYGIQEDYVSAAMKNGSIMEPESRRFYEFERNCEVQQVGFCLTDDGRFGCSPDSLVGDEGGLELKNPKTSTHIRYLADGKLPDCYRPQCHWCLIVTGRAWWDWLSYAPGLPHLMIRVTPDDFTEKLRIRMEQFWGMYQKLDAKIAAMREQAIDHAIATRGDQLPDDLRGLVPSENQWDVQLF